MGTMRFFASLSARYDARIAALQAPMAANSRIFTRLAARVSRLPALKTAVVHPVDAESLRGTMMAWRRNLIVPVLVGPEARIRQTAAKAGIRLTGLQIVATEHSHAAAAAA